MNAELPPPTPILWKQVLGLTALQSAITLMWLIYGLYLPQLMTQLGFPAELGAGLFMVENALAVVLEPLMGSLSDRSQAWMGTRFPFISVGVIAASALFIVLPVTVLLGGTGLRWVAILAILAWAIAMTVFRSPALALLRRYSAIQDLPIAVSLLTLASGLIGTTRPFVNQMILGLGPIATFTIASLVLLGATTALRISTPPAPPAKKQPASPPTGPSQLTLQALSAIALVGLTVSWGNRFVIDTLNRSLHSQFSAIEPGQLTLIVAVGMAIAAVPAGLLAAQFGNHRSLCLGALTTAGVVAAMALLPHPYLLIGGGLIFLLSLNFAIVGGVPFALSFVPAERAGLGVGMYFAGVSAAAGLLGLLLPPLDRMTVEMEAILGAIAFLSAAFCIGISLKFQRSHQRV
jgi:hypothetical protein